MERADLSLGDIIIYNFEDSEVNSVGEIVDKIYIIVGIITYLDEQQEYNRPSVTVQDLKVIKHWHKEEPFLMEQSGVYLSDITEVVGNALDPLAKKYPELII